MANNTIALKGEYTRKEAEASEAVTPGELVEFGGSNDIQKHSTAGGNARAAFALENDLVGEGIDDDYDSGDRLQYGVFRQGAEVYALLATGAASAVSVSKGSPVESAGDGTVQNWATAAEATPVEVDNLVGYALESVDNSAGGSEARIKIEVA